MSWTLDEGLEEASCGGLLILAESSHDPDLASFVCDVHLGECFLVQPIGGKGRLGYLTAMESEEAASTGLSLLEPDTLGVEAARRQHGLSAGFWSAVLERGLVAAGVEPTSLALGGRMALGAAHEALSGLEAGSWRFRDGRSLLLRHRKKKTRIQIEETRRSAAGVCSAFRRTATILGAARHGAEGLAWEGQPLTAGVLRREIALALAESGLGQPKDNIVAAGATASVPHTMGGNGRVLHPGETIVIDLFPKGALFADCTRTFCLGTPPSAVAVAHGLVKEALEAAYEHARVGCRMWDLQEMTCELFAKSGMPTPISDPGTTRGYVHGLGHGVGCEIHEYPSFAQNAGAEGILEPGDVFTLEPGLYDKEAGYGVRLEDLCLATEDGIENLTPLQYDLDPRSWRGGR